MCRALFAPRKKTFMKKTIFAAVTGIILVSACSKSNDSTTPVPPPIDPVDSVTSADLLAAHTWNIDTIALDTDKDGTIDMSVPGGLKPCDMDNTLKFNIDSTGTFDEGTMKCVDTTAQSVPFTWYLKNTDSVVNITGAIPGELHGDINVLTLTDSTLIMSKTIPYGDVSANLIISLKK